MQKTTLAIFFILAFCAFTFGQNANCPKISITGPSAVLQSGDFATFTVSVSGAVEDSELRYVWSVSSGKIVEGQGTATMTIGEIPLDSSPTATVEIKGLPEGCENTDSETASSGCSRPSPVMLDEFEISSRINAPKLDALIGELEKTPGDSAYLIIYSHKKDSSNKLKGRADYIRDYLRAKKIEPERLVFVRVSGDEYDLNDSVIRIWRVPPGAEPPTP